MADPKRVLYFAENALSAIQGGGIVAYAVLDGLPPDRLLGFFDYRNITPVPHYAERFIYLGPRRTPLPFRAINRATGGRSVESLYRLCADRYVRKDFDAVREHVTTRQFAPEVVYFAGLSYRYLRLAVMAAEHYDLPMVVLHMDDWMQVEREAAGSWLSAMWSRRVAGQLTRAAARSLASTSNSPRLAAKLTATTGFRHVAANNCCAELQGLPSPSRPPANRVPIITYTGAMNRSLQGETLKVLASAVTELNAEGTKVHLHIYTPWEFAPDANAIAVPDAVFYKGQVGRDRLAAIFAESDFLATTVTYRNAHISLFRHSLSTKLSEYLCAGRPVISMGHHDWHLHEYVQDHGCGFSLLMDEHFSRARIKEQLRRILSTDPATLERIGRNNRELWTRSHDVRVMARQTRRAIGLDTQSTESRISDGDERRGALWVGGPIEGGDGWVPAAKLTAICRRLVDVFEQDAVDLIGHDVMRHPELDAVLRYCHDVGLRPTICLDATDPDAPSAHWEPAGTRWSLARSQRRADVHIDPPRDLFEQIAELRGEPSSHGTPVQRAINQLTVRLSEHASKAATLWCYGDAAVGLALIDAIRSHRWLARAVEIGGFISAPGLRTSDTLHGHRWCELDEISAQPGDLIAVTCEASRLAIQEELSRHGLLQLNLPLYGSNAEAAVYERMPDGPGQAFLAGSSARDYATRELRTLTASVERTTARNAPRSVSFRAA